MSPALTNPWTEPANDRRALAERLAAAARGLGGDGQLRSGGGEMVLLPLGRRTRRAALRLGNMMVVGAAAVGQQVARFQRGPSR